MLCSIEYPSRGAPCLIKVVFKTNSCQSFLLGLTAGKGVYECYQSLTAHQHQKGHTVPKQVITICNVNSSCYSLSTALCESVCYQAMSEQNVRQDLIPRGTTFFCWDTNTESAPLTSYFLILLCLLYAVVIWCSKTSDPV